MEYIIWGKDPQHEDEYPLYTLATTPEEARRVMDILAKDHGCTDMKIQELDLTQPFDFVKACGLQ